jgi:hypothetical protein
VSSPRAVAAAPGALGHVPAMRTAAMAGCQHGGYISDRGTSRHDRDRCAPGSYPRCRQSVAQTRARVPRPTLERRRAAGVGVGRRQGMGAGDGPAVAGHSLVTSAPLAARTSQDQPARRPQDSPGQSHLTASGRPGRYSGGMTGGQGVAGSSPASPTTKYQVRAGPEGPALLLPATR